MHRFSATLTKSRPQGLRLPWRSANRFRRQLLTDCTLQLECMKPELLVIVDQQATVNTFPGLFQCPIGRAMSAFSVNGPGAVRYFGLRQDSMSAFERPSASAASSTSFAVASAL